MALVIIPGFDDEQAARFGVAVDDLYESDLMTCRSEGHRRLFRFHDPQGREILICARCNARFLEDVDAR